MSLPLARFAAPARWAALLAASALTSWALQAMHLPAALLLGPLAAAVLVQSAGGAVKIPRLLLIAAQAVIGCLIARAITPAIVAGFASHWPIFFGVVALSLAGALVIGWGVSRLGVIPGGTAVWGMLPGAATAMMVMAEAHGADFRLVAFMQYVRIVIVALVAALVALMVTHGGGARFAGGFFPPIDLPSFAATIVVAAIGGALGVASRVPAGALLAPLALGAALNVLGLVKIELPPAVLIASYALIGWNTGLRFTRDVLAAAARALPQSLGATALLMLFCGALAWALIALLHIDPLTAYLATSPGGIDAAVIIAASTKVDMPFVMALQVVRVVVILAFGPHAARWVAETLGPRELHPDAPLPLDLGDTD